jgi:Kef-type K+ transport system membrane component KefB
MARPSSSARNAGAYVLLIAVSVAITFALVHYGRALQGPAAPASGAASAPPPATLRILLIQVVVTLAAAHGLGAVARALRQPTVIGEIAGGIVLGPAILGYFWPAAYRAIFSAESLGALQVLADAGVIFFMFAVGLEIDLHALRGATHRAVVISHASIVVPFLLGVTAALVLYRTFAPAGTPFVAFALFTGTAMAITAFPVLARMLSEWKMASTSLGTMALTCASVDDITAWGLLSLVVAIVQGHGRSGVALVVALTVVFVVVMMKVVRPLLLRTRPGDATLILLMFASAAATELIGIHAIFGAFLAGVVAPIDAATRRRYAERLSIVTPALLPLFFAYVGVRTQLALIGDAATALACAAIILIATAGKLGGSAIAARLTGMPWRDSLTLGALMNTRGLMELVAVNIAYDLGILTPAMFAILVVMALVATAATGPLLALIRPAELRR